MTITATDNTNLIMSPLKFRLYSLLNLTGILPNLGQLKNPFKIHEFLTILAGARLAGNDQILDLGCGAGIQTQLLAKRCAHVIGVDPNQSSIERADALLTRSRLRAKITYMNGDLLDLRLSAGSLDRVFSFCVLEHIPHYGDVLAEIYRLLRPGGQIHLSVDSLATIEDGELETKHRLDHHVHQYFSLDTLRQALTSVGLEVQQAFPIFTGPYAGKMFSQGIQRGYFAANPVRRYLIYRKLVQEDRVRAGVEQGIMLVAHAVKPRA